MKRTLEIAASVTGQFARVVLRIGFVLGLVWFLFFDSMHDPRVVNYRQAHGLPSLDCLVYNTAAQCEAVQ